MKTISILLLAASICSAQTIPSDATVPGPLAMFDTNGRIVATCAVGPTGELKDCKLTPDSTLTQALQVVYASFNNAQKTCEDETNSMRQICLTQLRRDEEFIVHVQKVLGGEQKILKGKKESK